MTQQRSRVLRTALACATAAAALTPGAIFAQATNSGSGNVSSQTTVAVKLISKNHAQTGTATLTQQKRGVHVAVTLDQAPATNAVAIIRKGSCPISVSSGSGSSSANGGSAMSNASSGSGASAGSTSSTAANGTSANGTSGSMSGMGGANGSSAMSGSSGSTYQIGQIKATQGTTGQAAGVAETTLPNVQLTQLVQQGYSVDITSGASSSEPMLCSDLQNPLPPTTPAGSQ